MKKINLWTIIALLGLFVAVCTADGSAHELLLRACGASAFAVGAKMAGWMRREEDDRVQG